MTDDRLDVNAFVDKIKYFINEKGFKNGFEKLKHFLVFAILFEAVTVKLWSIYMENNDEKELSNKKNTSHKPHMDKVIKEMHSSGKISKKEFEQLEKFRKDRNECFHSIFFSEEGVDVVSDYIENIENSAEGLLEEHEETFALMFDKLEKSALKR